MSSDGSAAESASSQAEWQQVLTESKKEGKVVVPIPVGVELRNSLKEIFEKRLGVEIELIAGRGSAIVRRIADANSADIGLTQYNYFDKPLAL